MVNHLYYRCFAAKNILLKRSRRIKSVPHYDLMINLVSLTNLSSFRPLFLYLLQDTQREKQ